MLNNRKRKLIRHDLQLKVVFISLFVASLVLLINFQLSLAALWSLSGKLASGTDVMVAFEQLRQSVITRFLVSVGMAIPLSAAIGILYSFKFSGPIYRFEQYFGELSRGGRWDERCRLRENDDLQDVCQSINNALDDLRDFLVENRTILQDLQALHARGALEASDEARATLNQLMNRIAVVNATYHERLSAWPPPETGSARAERHESEEAGDGGAVATSAASPSAASGEATGAAASATDAGAMREEEKHLETQI